MLNSPGEVLWLILSICGIHSLFCRLADRQVLVVNCYNCFKCGFSKFFLFTVLTFGMYKEEFYCCYQLYLFF